MTSTSSSLQAWAHVCPVFGMLALGSLPHAHSLEVVPHPERADRGRHLARGPFAAHSPTAAAYAVEISRRLERSKGARRERRTRRVVVGHPYLDPTGPPRVSVRCGPSG